MKKIISIFLVFVLVISLSAAAFATAPGFDPAPEYTNPALSITGEGDSDSTNIPVYGYIGPDATITDKDPENPDNEPEIIPIATLISVSVPVKLLWAAFASNGGNIVSPDYEIRNYSRFAVDVKMTSFTVDNDLDSGSVVLNLEAPLGGSLARITNVVGIQKDFGYIAASADGLVAKTAGFTISGEYSGNFGAVQQPTYTMVLTFSLSNND